MIEKEISDMIKGQDKADLYIAIIDALSKQIPRKPEKTRREIVCPRCRTLVGSNPYCKYCGQKLDWEGQTNG